MKILMYCSTRFTSSQHKYSEPILILSHHVLRLKIFLLVLCFPPKIVYAFSFSPLYTSPVPYFWQQYQPLNCFLSITATARK